MFGFLRAQVKELKVKNYNLGESYYCGLCYALGKEYGTLSRSLTNYDSTFYAILADAQLGAAPSFLKTLCPPRPYLKVRVVRNEAPLRFAAGIAVMMLASKLQDDAADGGGWRPRSGMLLIRRTIRKAKQDLEAGGFPIGLILKEWQEQKEIEQGEGPGMELCARPTATVLSKVFEHTAVLAGAEENREVCARIGHAVGELVFLTDHLLDYPEDVRTGRFNALAAEARTRGLPVAGSSSPPEPVRALCQEICFERMKRIQEDAEALRLKQHEELTRNILEMGLPNKITHIFTCRDPHCKKLIHQPPTFAKFPFNLLGLQ